MNNLFKVTKLISDPPARKVQYFIETINLRTKIVPS